MKTKPSYASIAARSSRSQQTNSSGSPNGALPMNPSAAKIVVKHARANRAIAAVAAVAVSRPVQVAAEAAEASVDSPQAHVKCIRPHARHAASKQKFLLNHPAIVRFTVVTASSHKRPADVKSRRFSPKRSFVFQGAWFTCG